MNKLLLKKSIKIVAIVLVSVFVTAGAVSIGLWEYAKDVYAINQEENLRYQAEHMDYLKNEFYLDYAPKGEQAFCDFNLDEALESGVKYNEVA
ncbi:MAG: hypothetical protein J6R44_03710, partial [Clostridia bacterium]|nr:hypothetical protein [Clostridia bacterium]